MLLLVALPVGQAHGAEGPVLVGRCPLEKCVALFSGPFSDTAVDDILVVQDLGQLELSRSGNVARASVGLQRLVLLRVAPQAVHQVWQSQPYTSSGAAGLGISGESWALGDYNADGLTDILQLSVDSCHVVSFSGDSIVTRALNSDAGMVDAAVGCDVNEDGIPDIAVVERPGATEQTTARLVRVYQIAGDRIVPHAAYRVGVDWGESTDVVLVGAARLDDYPGVLPVIAGVRRDVRPSIYATLYEPEPDSLVLTSNPFPWQEWFSKELVLPAGGLTLFNVGDTLVAYGYFVPGLRPGGPPRSFAALQDGEWRLLQLTDAAQRLAGPVCRFRLKKAPGWLELRDTVFYFYEGEVFVWRQPVR